MIMKKLISGILLTLVLVLMAGVSSMANVVEYNLWVGGTRVTSDNAGDVFGDGKVSYSDGSPGTLTLTNYSYSGNGHIYDPQQGSGAGIFTFSSPLKIVLNGDNSVIVSNNSATNYGVRIEGVALSIEGAGSLTVSSNGGIYVGQKLTIDGGTVSANGQYGIYANGGLTISGGTVIANGNGNNDSYGIRADNGLTISGGKVSATGNKYGINAGSGSNYVYIVGDSTVIAAGGTKSINGLVQNTKIGTGWTDKGGTEGEDQISVSTGQNLSFRKVQFPDVLNRATVTVAPKAKTLTYTGSAQELVTAGTTNDGTMQYALGVNGTTAPTTYTSSIPSGTNAGIYYVWYMVDGDEWDRDSIPTCIQVTIAEAKGSYTYASTAGNLPKTGDAQNPLLYAVIALISVAGIGLFRKRME